MKTAKGFITKFLTGILVFAILAVTAFLITFFAVRFKGFKVDPVEHTKQTNELCIYECEEGKASIDSEIARLNQEGMTVIMISHDADEAIKYASKILYLSRRYPFYGKTADYLMSEAYARTAREVK